MLCVAGESGELFAFEGSVKFKGFQILQLPFAFVFRPLRPLVNSTVCSRVLQMLPFTAAIQCRIVGSFVLYLIFTESLSLMHGLSLSAPAISEAFIVNRARVTTI